MDTRIIKLDQSDEFWEQFEKDGYCRLSQRRSGRVVHLEEGDAVFIFRAEKGDSEGEVRYKCLVAQTDEDINNGEDTYVKLELEETYNKDTCTYDDLKENGLVKLRNFHWNKLPELIEFMKDKGKTKVPKKKKPDKKTEKKPDKKRKNKKDTKKAVKKKSSKKKRKKK